MLAILLGSEQIGGRAAKHPHAVSSAMPFRNGIGVPGWVRDDPRRDCTLNYRVGVPNIPRPGMIDALGDQQSRASAKTHSILG